MSPDGGSGRTLTFGRYLMLTWVCLVLVFTVLEPRASAGLGLAGRLVFWLLHVGFGLLILEGATRVLSRFGGRGIPRALALLAIAALVGSLLLAPIALATEWALGQPEGDESDETPLGGAGLGGELLDEALAVAPGVTFTWILINVPWLLRMDFSARGEAPSDAAPGARGGAAPGPGLLDNLPDALGRDLVAISSELHYLRVYTTRGETLVLYTLRDALDEIGGVEGERIHRSHWVARAHVVRVRREGRRMSCVLSNELVLPVSRSHQPRMIEVFGDRARYRA